MNKVAVIGEVMAELSPVPRGSDPLMKLGFGGDTFNTAIYLSRMGGQVDYITRLGDDPYSHQILAMLRAEKVGIDDIEQVVGRCVGLYAIENFDKGERRFFYWRGESPARELFDPCSRLDKLFATLQCYDYLYLTGITLAVISDRARRALFGFIGEYRERGGRFIFDSNYRPRLWESDRQAQSVMEEALSLSDIALLTYEDEALLWNGATVAQRLDVYRQQGIAEVVLKQGAEQVVLMVNGQLSFTDVPKVDKVVDTTAAGDSFNGAYIAARLRGLDAKQAVVEGCACAAQVIQHHGAII